MAVEIDAITSQLIPFTDGPGAHEAGVIYFIVACDLTFYVQLLGSYGTGMDTVQKKRREMFPLRRASPPLRASSRFN